jgi:putative SOS response-associated peptidase YedK
MCSNYTPSKRSVLPDAFGVEPPADDWKEQAFPGYLAPIVRMAEDGSGELESVRACFGMVPRWAELKLSRHTYNARSETVASKPSFRHAYAKRQLCIVPAESIFEPNYESGKAVRWRIARDDGKPMGIAGLWEWRPNGGPDDRPLASFTMLTINADAHPLMRRFHRPEDEKRMVVILSEAQYRPWLEAGVDAIRDFLLPYAAERLVAEPAPRSASSGTSARVTAPKAVPKSLWD